MEEMMGMGSLEKRRRIEEEDEDVLGVGLGLPGFRFHPTDEELVGFYLSRKVLKKPPSKIDHLIHPIDIYKYDPWDLPRSRNTEKESYFFCKRGRKYRNSIRPNRVTGSGFWKATGIDKPVYSDTNKNTLKIIKNTLKIIKNMFFTNDIPSISTIFTTYASIAGYIMMLKSLVAQLIPSAVQDYIFYHLQSLFFKSHSSTLTLSITEDNMGLNNEIYRDAQTYLSTKISPDASRLKISKYHKDKHVNVFLSDGEIVLDIFQEIELKWQFINDATGENRGSRRGRSGKSNDHDDGKSEFFELSFDKKHKDLILNTYIPYIETKAKEIRSLRRNLKLYSLNSLRWESVQLDHPSTFETMAMEDELKCKVVEDLDRFIKRKEFYKRVGKAWKRGYLLYGPPGTGKSSLVAAMANYLKFDVYDLQLASVMRDSDLRRLLLATRNRSILVIEDIDCAVDLPNRLQREDSESGMGKNPREFQGPLTLSGLLNFIDGLWSSCGDERIIIFTTNHKEKLDPALLRPGRMDMHIYMGHCTFQGFKTLASNYLCLNDVVPHPLYPEIERLIDGEVITPAQVAEELMKSDDADVALDGLAKVLEKLRSGKSEDETEKIENENGLEIDEKRLRVGTKDFSKKNRKIFKKLVTFWA